MIMKLAATEFLSFISKNLIFIIKHNGKVKLSSFQYNFLHIYVVVQNLKLVFLGKIFCKDAIALKSKKVQEIFEETFIFALQWTSAISNSNRTAKKFEIANVQDGKFKILTYYKALDKPNTLFTSVLTLVNLKGNRKEKIFWYFW